MSGKTTQEAEFQPVSIHEDDDSQTHRRKTKLNFDLLAQAVQMSSALLARKLEELRSSIVRPAIVGGFNIYDIRQFGTLAKAIAAIPEDKQVTLFITKMVDVSTDTTTPANISIVRLEGGYFTSSNASELEILGPFSSPNSQTFFGNLVVVFGDHSILASKPEWFGAVGDGSTDCTAAIRSAFRHLVVEFGVGTYLISDVLTISSGHVIRGVGKRSSVLKCGSGTQLSEAFIIGYSVESVSISDIGFDNSENYPDDETTGGNLEAYYLGDTPYSPMNGAIKFRNGGRNINVTRCSFSGITGMSIQFLQHPTLFYHGIRIRNNDFVDGAYIRKVISIEGGDNAGGEVEDNCSTDIIIDGNFINGNGPQKYTMPGIIFRNASCDAISLDHCARFTVVNNRIEYSSGVGIRIEQSLFGQVIGNIVSESGESGVSVYADSQHIIVANNTIKSWGRIPNLGYLRKYDPGSGTKYYIAREFADGVVVTLPADPTSQPWISECPYDLTGLDLSNVPLWDDGNYYDDGVPFTSLPDGGDIANPGNFTVPSWMGILPYRGCGGIAIHQRSRRVIVANNRITGDTTQVGGKYTHASDFGISTVHPTNQPVAYDSPLIAYGNLIQGATIDYIYQPSHVDPINSRGAISGVKAYHGNHHINPSTARIEEIPASYDLDIGGAAGRYIKIISSGVVKYELDATDLHHFYTAMLIDGALQVKGSITAGDPANDSDTAIIIDAVPGGTRSKNLVFRDGGVENFILRLSTGGNIQFRCYDNAGAFVDNPISITRLSGGVDVNRDLSLAVAGRGLKIKEGTNARMGVATLSAGTVTVANTSVTANTRILLTIQSLGTVAVPQAIAVTARTPGTSFTITSADATDTSVVLWDLKEPA